MGRFLRRIELDILGVEEKIIEIGGRDVGIETEVYIVMKFFDRKRMLRDGCTRHWNKRRSN